VTTPGSTETEPDSGYARLEQQINWYDSKSRSAQNWHKRVKIVEIACTAAIPVVAPFHGIAAACLGGAVLLLETVQHLNQWHHNWITYRSTCEALRHEKYTYIEKAGVYDGLGAEAARKVLVQRVESLISTEHAKWISRQEYDVKKIGKPEGQ